jgi:Zn-finger nucleic acid-binding protein
MKCPRCAKDTLKEVKSKKITLDKCVECEGLWFDKGEIAAVSEAAAELMEIPKDAAHADTVCPRCVKPLFTFKYPDTDIVVDMCRECAGIWLDKGEFNNIMITRQKLISEGKIKQNKKRAGILRFLESISSGLHGK